MPRCRRIRRLVRGTILILGLALSACGTVAAQSDTPAPSQPPVVSGIVVLADDPDQPVSGAKIQGVSTAAKPGPMLNIVAGPDGRFQFKQRSDELLLWASDPDGKRSAIVKLPADTTGIKIPLKATASAVGRIVDRNGTPLAGYEVSASVRLYRNEEGTSFQKCFPQISKCDENGRFVLPGIVVGQKYYVSVVVERERMSSWTAAEMVAEEARPWDLGDRKMFRVLDPQGPATGLDLFVVDVDGRPVEGFEAMLHTHEGPYISWRQGRAGRLYIESSAWRSLRGSRKSKSRIELLVRAQGFAARMLVVDESDTRGLKKIKLARGRRVVMNLKPAPGTEIPADLRPDIYLEEHRDRVRMMRQPSSTRPGRYFDINCTSVKTLAAGRYELNLPDEVSRFCVSIDQPGFLRRYEAGPFTSDDLANERLDLDLPTPAGVQLRFTGPAGPEEKVPFASSYFDVYWCIPGSSSMYSVARGVAPGREHELVVKGLAPGEYRVSVATVPKKSSASGRTQRPHPGAFRDSQKILLAAGQLDKVGFDYVPLDPDAFRGDHAVTIRVLRYDGQPVSGRAFKVTYGNRHYGSLTVREGTLPAEGEIHLENIVGGTKDAQYGLSIQGEYLGQLELSGGEKHRTREFRLAPGKGDPVPDIVIQDSETKEQLTLSDFRGQAVYLEFWATWCGPCQRPMAALNALWERRRADWQGKAALLPLSIDSDVARLEQHVRRRGWQKLRHFWSGENENGFDAVAAQRFVVNGVPTAMLIDSQGVIVWRGHPTGFDVEGEIDKLLVPR